MAFSSSEDFDNALTTVRAAFASGKTKDKDWRRRQLRRTWWMLEENRDVICAAVYEDLHKHQQEVLMSDVCGIQNDIIHTLDHLDEWTKDERPDRLSLINLLGGTTVRKEPLGVSLIIGAWNYPLLLLFQPMVAAIAAGCAVILKPSDVSLASQDLIMNMVPKYLDEEAIRCVSAGPQQMSYILSHRFDQIFYTGSSNVAKIVHAAAAKHLTPVVLELGGQGPAIVCKSANIDMAARRLAATKFMNAGQICLNVNHIFVDPSVRELLVDRLIHYFNNYMGGDPKRQPSDYTAIVNTRNFDRLDGLLQRTSGNVLYGGARNRQSRFWAPTIVSVSEDDVLLSEELFGPILPIIDADLESALAFTRSKEHPLAIYAFTSSAEDKAQILQGSQSGGVTFNDCMMHAAASGAPFGGVGHSGLGYYHGKYGLIAFSHLRTYLSGPPAWMDAWMTFRFPPYSLAKARKMSPSIRPPFDREGNVKASFARRAMTLAIGAVVLATIASAVFNS